MQRGPSALVALLLSGIAVFAPAPALATAPIVIQRSTAIPSVDPLSDPVAWSNAATAALTWDVQRGRRMREESVARVATDGNFLFVRFDVRQSEPIVAEQRTNDVGQGTDDAVWVDLWPSGTSGYQYQFAANPNGTHYQSSSENTTYAPHWESYGARHKGGYTVTMRIPLDAMRNARSSALWKVQFVRYIRATGEQAVWSYDSAQTSPDDPARAGSMQMVAHNTERPKPRVATYVLAAAAAPAAGGSTSRTGLDLSIPFNDNSSFYATFHPDFSNVELDQQTIAPTVYPRAFAEVRPFFTQGANNFNNFYCNFCNGFASLYTPAIPTPRSGYAIEGKSGAFGFTGFEAVGASRTDDAAGIVYVSPDLRWTASVNRVSVDTPSFRDDETVTGAFYNDLKHITVYANYGTESGTSVLDGSRGQYYDAGATWSSQTFSAWGGVHRIGQYFNPADGFILLPGVSGWGLFANKIWTMSSNDTLSAVSLGGDIVRNHADDGGINQTQNKLDLDLLTRSAIDLNLTSSSTYLLLSNGLLTPVSQSGAALTYHSGSQTNNPISFDAHGPSATPTMLSYNTGRFGEGRLDTWLRTSTLRAGARGSITLELDDTAQRFAAGTANVQWFERAGYTYQLSSDASIGIGLRRVVGFPPVPNGGGNCEGRCSNVSFAYHQRLRHIELYVAYGDPNALDTVPQLLLKAIFYAGADKGT